MVSSSYILTAQTILSFFKIIDKHGVSVQIKTNTGAADNKLPGCFPDRVDPWSFIAFGDGVRSCRMPSYRLHSLSCCCFHLVNIVFLHLLILCDPAIFAVTLVRLANHLVEDNGVNKRRTNKALLGAGISHEQSNHVFLPFKSCALCTSRLKLFHDIKKKTDWSGFTVKASL